MMNALKAHCEKALAVMFRVGLCRKAKNLCKAERKLAAAVVGAKFVPFKILGGGGANPICPFVIQKIVKWAWAQG